MTPEQEVKVLQEVQRHQQALDDISSGKAPEKEVSKEDEFIKLMQEINNSSTVEPEQEPVVEIEFIKLMQEINK